MSSVQEKIEALRKKQQKFEQRGELSQATTAKIIADFLEEWSL